MAANCAIVHHGTSTEADMAYLAGEFAKAAELYKTALAKSPESTDVGMGLVHSLLRQQRVVEALDEVHELVNEKPMTAALLTLRAEVELRQGEPWSAAETASASAKLDACNPRTMLMFARLAEMNSRHATARKLLTSAHQLDPEDAEIRTAWMETLPAAERIPQLEAYLSAPRGEDTETLSEHKAELEGLKKWVEEPRPPCNVTAKAAPAEIPFGSIRSMRGDVPSPELNVQVNHHIVHLWFDTSYNARLPMEGMSGLLLLKSAAEHMGLKPLFENMVPGTGPQGPRKGYVAYADSIELGGLEFHNCAVQVMEGLFGNDGDGIISLNLFSDFLVTLDFPSNRLILGPLPQLPEGGSANGDRTIAPEMKDYTPVYRAGTDVILPVMVNRKFPKLFLMDTAVGFTMLSPEAAHEIAEGHKDRVYEVRDLNGTDTRFSAGDVQLSFAGLSQNVTHIASYDTSRFTADSAMQISGLLGNSTLRDVTVHLDLRDGLVKMVYKSNSARAH
jgi:thioredoxin-like negative regulator of GroEL